MSTDPHLPICHFCGQPMRVRDLRSLALAKGMEPPEDIRFTIACCGYTLLISDDFRWYPTILPFLLCHDSTLIKA
jgi:hypothetical protein